jgi:LexA-binding, inner membrane-associated putative hydrolase
VSPVTHLLTGWVIANSVPLERKDRALVTLAAVIPDIDGLGIVADLLTRHSQHPLDWFASYHHSLHTLFFAFAITVTSYLLAIQRGKTAALVFLSFHLHLLEDWLGSRGPDGYQWPVPYLMPFAHVADLRWTGQWALNAWPNFAITAALLLVTFYLAWLRGFSLLEMFSNKADAVFVSAIRRRLSVP